MKENFEPALKAMLHHEGGFVDHPKDPGGMTNLGVTKKVWEEWVGHEVNEKVMRSLTPEIVGPMYKRKYWDRIKGDDLPQGVDYIVFDAAVNSGTGRAAKWLQAVVGVEQDGGIGPKTIAAVNAYDPKKLIEDYSDRRLAFLTALPTWETFGRGWGRRVAEVKTSGLAMV
jgi:lysozyme family protein